MKLRWCWWVDSLATSELVGVRPPDTGLQKFGVTSDAGDSATLRSLRLNQKALVGFAHRFRPTYAGANMGHPYGVVGPS